MTETCCQNLHNNENKTLSCSGEGTVDTNDPNKENSLSQLAKTEISLTLTNKFELLDGDDKNMKGLMTK